MSGHRQILLASLCEPYLGGFPAVGISSLIQLWPTNSNIIHREYSGGVIVPARKLTNNTAYRNRPYPFRLSPILAFDHSNANDADNARLAPTWSERVGSAFPHCPLLFFPHE